MYLLTDDLLLRRDSWFATAETKDTWRVLNEVAPGTSRPLKVECDRDSFIGIAKPNSLLLDGRYDADRLSWAAREKLAFGLAYLLNLPIPPVLLWDRGPRDNPHEEARYLAISAAVFPFVHWEEAVDHLSATDVEMTRAIFSAMHVFDTWIAGTNRSAAHTLIHKPSLDAGRFRVAFIDHASSMTFHKRVPWPSRVTEYNLPLPPDSEAVLATIKNISALDRATIYSLLGTDRIPPAYLPQLEREIICDELVRRKDRLREMLGV